MYRWIRNFTPALTLGLLLTASQASAQVVLFTSFEPPGIPLNSTNFTLGTPPDSVTFTGGITASTLNPFAYRSGIAAWGVFTPNQVATADFDNPALIVWFYTVNVGGASGVIEVFDQADVSVGSFPVTQTNMMNNLSLMGFSAAQFGVAGIGKLTMTNSAGAGHQVWIDDFNVNSPIPEPATLLVVSAGLALMAARRRRRSLKTR